MKTKITIGLTDPNQLMRQGVISLLKEQIHIHPVFTAENFSETMEHLSRHVPHLLIVGMEVPSLQDIETLRTLVQSYPGIKIIALTGNLSDVLILELLSIGTKAILPKTTSINSIVKIIEEVYSKGFYYDTEITDTIERRFQIEASVAIQITKREKEVLDLLILGNTNKEAAKKLCISQRTLEGHRQSIIKKTGIRNLAVLKEWSAKYLV